MITKATSKFVVGPAVSPIRVLTCMKVTVTGCLGFFVLFVFLFFCMSRSSDSRWKTERVSFSHFAATTQHGW